MSVQARHYLPFCLCTILLLLAITSVRAQDTLTVRNIYISGNKLTKEFVIKREMTLKEGQKIPASALADEIATSRKFVYNTLIFLSVSITDSIQGKDVNLYVHVSERWYIIPSAQFHLTDRNFNEWIRHRDLYRITYGLRVTDPNFLGRRQMIIAQVLLGWRQTFTLQYRIPYLNKSKTLGLQLNTYYEQGHEVGAITENNNLVFTRVDAANIYYKRSAEAALIYRPRYRLSHTLLLGYDYYNISDTVSRYINPDYLGHGRDRLAVPHAVYTLTWDKRDFVFYPTNGYYLSGSVEKDGIPKNGGIDITTFDLTARYYYRPPERKIYYMLGFISEYTPGHDVPYAYHSALGYRWQVRGFEHYLVDGNSYFLGSGEIKYKILDHLFDLPLVHTDKFRYAPLQIYLKLFADAGAVGYYRPYDNNTLVNRVLAGYGPGVDFVSYYDNVMRVEYSFNSLGQSGLFLHFFEIF